MGIGKMPLARDRLPAFAIPHDFALLHVGRL
jgi:hypothetical protein